MSIRVHRPETVRLELSRSDWILVKRYLTAGEYRALIKASVKPVRLGAVEAPGAIAPPAQMELDAVAAGLATVQAYLLDWSFQQPDGRPLVIADQAPEVVAAALAAIDSEAYMEVQRAIQTHQAAVAAELREERANPFGETAPTKILTSVE